MNLNKDLEVEERRSEYVRVNEMDRKINSNSI